MIYKLDFQNCSVINFQIDLQHPTKKLFEVTSLFGISKLHHQLQLHQSQGVKGKSGKTFVFKIWKETLLVKKQQIPKQKVLDLSFNLATWKWAWHYHKSATPSCPRKTFFTPWGHMLFAASRHRAIQIMPSPFLGCQIKAEIKGFLLMYLLFLY